MAMTNSTKKTTTRKPRAAKPKATTKKPTVKKAAPSSIELPTNPFVFEILELASSQRSAAKKVEVLKKYDHNSVKSVLIWNFDESVISLLPEGVAPYASTKEQTSYSGTLGEKIETAVNMMNELGSQSLGSQDQGQTSIRKEYKYFYNFIKGGNETLSKRKIERTEEERHLTMKMTDVG